MLRSTPNLRTLAGLLRHAGVTARNLLADLPGERPEWVVLELSGTFPARAKRRKLLAFPPALGPRDTSLEELEEQITALALALWLRGVVFRVEGLQCGMATAYAIRGLMAQLRAANKRTAIYLTKLELSDYYLAAAADEVIMPDGAEPFIAGLALQVTFMRDALARFGLRFERFNIDEYKNAMDPVVRQEMSVAQREQLDALLDSIQGTVLGHIAADRKVDPRTVRSWIDEGVTSAQQALSFGMLDRIAYEDQVVSKQHKPFAASRRFLRSRPVPLDAGRVAVVTLEGVIVPGKSRRSPLPLPIFGEAQAGSETLIAAFRAAEQDPQTAAIVFYVNSGGGSALASDLIWREVFRIRKSKPIVAVMGAVAASGGYYVLAHADHVIAAPMTITGSIGVITGKLVMDEFNAKYGLNPEAVARGRYALTYSSARGFTNDEATLVKRSMHEIYDRFTSRVAEGRKLTKERVNDIGRGRIWSGTDALERGLVDELGDVRLAISRAREIAGLPADAPVWTVEAPSRLLLPTPEDPTTLWRTVTPLLNERALLLQLPLLEVL
jgi:protease-4